MDWRDPEMVLLSPFRHAIFTSRGSSCCAVELTMQPIRSLVFQGPPGHHLRVSPYGERRSIFRSDLPKILQIHGEFTHPAQSSHQDPQHMQHTGAALRRELVGHQPGQAGQLSLLGQDL